VKKFGILKESQTGVNTTRLSNAMVTLAIHNKPLCGINPKFIDSDKIKLFFGFDT